MATVATPKRKKSTVAEQVVTPPSHKVRFYAAPVLLSAFLLFLVQPMLAKAILPWFGGVAGVWIVAMLFFQGMLVVGYGYAYLITRFLTAKLQALCHVGLLFGSLIFMPIAPWKVFPASAAADPSMQILQVLFLSVGLPYFLLSTTGPLIQTWYARAQRVALPYRLFALSNLGSLIALLAYPVVIEPFVTTRHQMVTWSVLYGTFALLATITAAQFWRSRPEAQGGDVKEPKQALAAPSWKDYVLWGALAACGSALLVTVMNHLCQDIAPIPLLWVLPLGTYLLTFILCFDRRGWHKPALLRWVLPLALGAMMYGIFHPNMSGVKVQVLIYLACLFVGCMFCHGELARRKPHHRYLTSFYLMLSLGGALATVAIGLIAPRVSTWQVEFPQVVVACAILGLLTLFPKHWMRHAAMAALVAAFGLLTSGIIHKSSPGDILKTRNFYGTLRVSEEQGTVRGQPIKLRRIYHGRIEHGTEFFGQQLESFPTTYYGAHSGIGLLLSGPRTAWNVGVVGLGAGTLAAYGRPADTFTFYEINPEVARLANSQFSYLPKSQAAVKVVIGDGRLSVQKEPPQKFNLLVVDAFSGDSIPVHLLTREAFQSYFSKLKAGGVVAVHITNQFINLAPPLAAVADDLHKQAVVVVNQDKETLGASIAIWVLITDDVAALPNLPQESWRTLSRLEKYQAWTDDYSYIFRLLQ